VNMLKLRMFRVGTRRLTISMTKGQRLVPQKHLLRTKHNNNYNNNPSIYLWLYSPLLDLGRFFSFLIFYTVGRTPWTGDQPVARPLSAHRTTQTQNKRTQTSIPQVGFKPTIPVFERTKTVHALDRAFAMIGNKNPYHN
jgi:hypothetical protein